jgi:GNAT superfamily N-acetyltransferase
LNDAEANGLKRMDLNFIPMTREQLPDVDRIQKDAYPDYFLEDLAVLAAKRELCPKGCWMCVAGETPVGYMFSHPGRLSSPPGLNTMLDNSHAAADANCYFIHDVAVMSSHRGLGIARAFVEHAIRAAVMDGHTTVALVSVQGSRRYWERLGFRPVQGPEETLNYIRQSYGDAACYMVKQCPTSD